MHYPVDRPLLWSTYQPLMRHLVHTVVYTWAWGAYSCIQVDRWGIIYTPRDIECHLYSYILSDILSIP